MWKRKLCLSTSSSFGLTTEEQIKLICNTGFEGFFTNPNETDTKAYSKLARELGMIYQSVHAPFIKAAKMWQTGEESQEAIDELIRFAELTSDAEVDLMIAHVWIGFGKNDGPSDIGVYNWDKVISRAEELGVRIALENTEGEEFLDYLLSAFKDRKNVGFCFDSGHEMCYNRSQDLLALYGDRLFGTHLNDNLGIRDFNGTTTYIDDLHLLPFDGIGDWEDIAKRLNKCGFDDILTFELIKNNSNGRYNRTKYEAMSIEGYIAECYATACKVAMLCEKFS